MCPSVTKQYNLVRDSNAVRVKLLSTETAAVCEVFVNIFCPAFLTASITRSQFFLYLISIFVSCYASFRFIPMRWLPFRPADLQRMFIPSRFVVIFFVLLRNV